MVQKSLKKNIFGGESKTYGRPKQQRYFSPSIEEKRIQSGLRIERRENLINQLFNGDQTFIVRNTINTNFDFFIQAIHISSRTIGDPVIRVGLGTGGTLIDADVFAIHRNRNLRDAGAAFVAAKNTFTLLPTPVRCAANQQILVRSVDDPVDTTADVLVWGWLEPSLF